MADTQVDSKVALAEAFKVLAIERARMVGILADIEKKNFHDYDGKTDDQITDEFIKKIQQKAAVNAKAGDHTKEDNKEDNDIDMETPMKKQSIEDIAKKNQALLQCLEERILPIYSQYNPVTSANTMTKLQGITSVAFILNSHWILATSHGLRTGNSFHYSIQYYGYNNNGERTIDTTLRHGTHYDAFILPGHDFALIHLKDSSHISLKYDTPKGIATNWIIDAPMKQHRSGLFCGYKQGSATHRYKPEIIPATIVTTEDSGKVGILDIFPQAGGDGSGGSGSVLLFTETLTRDGGIPAVWITADESDMRARLASLQPLCNINFNNATNDGLFVLGWVGINAVVQAGLNNRYIVKRFDNNGSILDYELTGLGSSNSNNNNRHDTQPTYGRPYLQAPVL